MNAEVSQAGANVFISAVQWLEQILLGTLAQAIAVIAVASLGFLLLTGRIDVRRGMQVILGCFVLFGASTIAAGIMNATDGTANPSIFGGPRLPAPQSPAAVAAVPYDPYAGAAMPTRQ